MGENSVGNHRHPLNPAKTTSEKMPDLIRMQKGEITEHIIYSRLAQRTQDPHNRSILQQIAKDELRHYGILKSVTKKDFQPNLLKVLWYSFLAKTLGFAFALKLMEEGEGRAQDDYICLAKEFPQIKRIIYDEKTHENELIDLIKEERLEYASAIVLGLNDALVELTGALAGLTLALQDATLVAVSGFMVGFAAALSMAASSYLSSREEEGKSKKSPLKSAAYTGITYMLTVLLLIAPYFIFQSVYVSLATMLLTALAIIAAYTFYISVAKSQRFLSRFLEMAAISLFVAAISFLVGFAARTLFGIDV